MDTKTITATIARRVNAAIDRAGATPATVAEATDMDAAELDNALRARRPFQVVELIRVGGFLHVAPDSFLGAAA